MVFKITVRRNMGQTTEIYFQSKQKISEKCLSQDVSKETSINTQELYVLFK